MFRRQEPQATRRYGGSSVAEGDTSPEATYATLQEERQLRRRLERELEYARGEIKVSRLEELRFDLQEVRSSLECEKQSREESEEKLKQRFDDYERRWKQAASELNRIRMYGQGFPQITDSYLEQLAKQLRYNISSLAISYFEGKIPGSTDIFRFDETSYWKKYMEPTNAPYAEYLMSSRQSSGIITAFIWRVLCGEVFGRFRWAGDVSHVICKVDDFIRDGVDPPDGPVLSEDRLVEAWRKYHYWRARTRNLLVKRMNADERDDTHLFRTNEREDIANNIHATIKKYLRKEPTSGYYAWIIGILNDASRLDEEISSQVARISWEFSLPEMPSTGQIFDSSEMQLEGGKRLKDGNQTVLLVTAPAMRKQGKSTGEDFHLENTLMKMEVSFSYEETCNERLGQEIVKDSRDLVSKADCAIWMRSNTSM